MKRKVLVAFLTVVAAALLLAPAAAGAAGVPVEPGTATQDAFPPAASCTCHTMLVDEWTVSMHAQALSDPVFNAKVAQADAATGGKLGPFCRTCHAPAAAMTGEIAAGSITGAGTQQGVGCMFCHQVIAMKNVEPGNTSHLVDPSGVRRAQLKDPQAPHPAEYSETHEQAAFCGGCHNVNHPVNGMHLESTFREWEKSPWADEGVRCQDCHMSEAPPKRGPSTGQAATGGPTRDNIFHMTFVGANVAQGPAEQSAAMLKSAAELKMEAPEIVAPGDSGEVSVTITNVGAGHYLPTGLTEVREMWLEVTAENADGTSTKVGERRFGTVLKDENGKFPAELWDAVAIESDDRIPPRESVTATYTVTMPAGAEKTTLKAALKYRSVPDELAKEAGVENPITEMAGATQPVFASEAAMAAEGSQDQEEPEPSGISTGLLVAVGVVVAMAVGVFVWMRSRKPS